MNINEKFDDYFNEIESYSMRCERFYDDLTIPVHITRNLRMVDWLKGAFEAGYERAMKDMEK